MMRYVIIGNGAAGIAAAQTIERLDRDGDITILTDEPHKAYYRPLIPMIIDGERLPEEICLEEMDLPQRATIRADARVQAIDSQNRLVVMKAGDSIRYDKLLVATGASPRPLASTGIAGPGIFYMRRVEDALAVRDITHKGSRVVIIGGGRIGCKVAVALMKVAARVTIIEKLDRLMPLQLDSEASILFENALRGLGVEIITGQSISNILRGRDGAITGITLENEQTVDTDIVLIAVGVKPNIELARQAGIKVKSGIVVDGYMRTSITDIYAAGDVVETKDVVTGESMVSGIWTNAVEMGQTAGGNMAAGGDVRQTKGAFALLNAMELAGLSVISVGMIHPPEGKGYEVLMEKKKGTYRKFVLRDDTLVGTLLVGRLDHAGTYASLIRGKTELGELKNMLLEPTFSYAPFLKTQETLINNYVS